MFDNRATCHICDNTACNGYVTVIVRERPDIAFSADFDISDIGVFYMAEQTCICSAVGFACHYTQVVDYGIYWFVGVVVVYLFTADTALENIAVSTDRKHVLHFERCVVCPIVYIIVSAVIIIRAINPRLIRIVGCAIVIVFANRALLEQMIALADLIVRCTV